ncbi:hypothetical protein KY366_04380 [Candidatus Woesearchaeota archaeon]|nr:hypothetical protein [Candidatus Woesearchaeota archaeon]
MQAKKTTTALMIWLLILLPIYGCTKTQKEYTPSVTSEEIYTGKQGLEMEFFENAPPEEVFENSPVPVGIRLYNKGAYDIEEGHLTIGLEKEYIKFNADPSIKAIDDDNVDPDDANPEHMEFRLKGKGVEHPDGENELITFLLRTLGKLNDKDPQSESHTSLMSVTSCYGYRTRAVETVCIDTDVYGFKKKAYDNDEKGPDKNKMPCTVGDITLASQGAPVAVTKIESEMLPFEDNAEKIKPRFTITIKNVGGGEVVRKDLTQEACLSTSIGYKEWNSVNVEAYLSDPEKEGNKLDCDLVKGGNEDDGTLILKEKEDIIRCSYEKGFDNTMGVFSSPLYIILDYGYTDTISTEVKIKKQLTH